MISAALNPPGRVSTATAVTRIGGDVLTLTGQVVSLERRAWTLNGRSGVKNVLHVASAGSPPQAVTLPEELVSQTPDLLTALEFGASVQLSVDPKLRQYDNKPPFVELVGLAVFVTEPA